jgi:hypothetical protein
MLFFLPEVLYMSRLLSVQKWRVNMLKKTKGSTKEIVSVDGSVAYGNLLWEPRAYRDPGQKDKNALEFNDSQKRLARTGYERHPLLSEIYSLICDHIDDQRREPKILNPMQAALAEELVGGLGTVCCQAMKTSQSGYRGSRKNVMFYDFVTHLPFNSHNRLFDESRMEFAGATTFEIDDLLLDSVNYCRNLHKEHDDLLEYLFSRGAASLPEMILEEGGIFLPQPGTFWMMCSRGIGDAFRFYPEPIFSKGASQGVRALHKMIK